MSDTNLELAFYGELASGHDAAAVRSNIAALFKASEAQVERMFSGKRIILKNRLDPDTAQKYVQAMINRGAVCKIEVMGQPGVEFSVASQPESVSAPEFVKVSKPESVANVEALPASAQPRIGSVSKGAGARVQVLGERLSVAGEDVDNILQGSDLEITDLGTRMQDEVEVPVPELSALDGVDLLPLGSRMQDESIEANAAAPDTSHLSLK